MNQITEQSTFNAIPIKWVDKIFERFMVLYGRKFAEMWAGIPEDGLKKAWAEDLAQYKSRPEAIKWALEACKRLDWPPTMSEFLKLCEQAPKPIEALHLPAPIDKEKAAMRLDAAAGALLHKNETDHLRWAKRLDLSERAKEMIMELVEERDPRFKTILAEHYHAGRIKVERARKLLNIELD